jgi:hypothetical protein
MGNLLDTKHPPWKLKGSFLSLSSSLIQSGSHVQYPHKYYPRYFAGPLYVLSAPLARAAGEGYLKFFRANWSRVPFEDVVSATLFSSVL